MRIPTRMKRVAVAAAVVVLLAVILVWSITFHPRDGQSETIFCDANAPTLKAGQTVKVLSWNVQFMASKGYLFFFEMPDDAGPDRFFGPPSAANCAGAQSRCLRARAEKAQASRQVRPIVWRRGAPRRRGSVDLPSGR